MRFLFGLALAAATTEQAQSNVTNITALVVAGGTLIAGVIAYLRLRTDRPKVIAEVAGLAETRLREELRTAWESVDRARVHEEELEKDLNAAHVKIRALEGERDALSERVARLERIVSGPPIPPREP